ncbi:MAG: omptin family outer membrane protease [Treponema sp.]|nr:omptin family outer membrane protease [Treponema sp.]
MKLFIILFIFSAINPLTVTGENTRKYEFSLGTGFGFVYGQSFEYVYANSEIVAELLSELTWEMKPVYYLGFHSDFSRKHLMDGFGFFSSVDFKVGIRGDSGVHENRDWMSNENSDLTHFSTHTNLTKNLFWLDLSVGLSIPVKPYFYIKPFISGSWMHFSFSGKNGHGIYARRTDCPEDCAGKPPCKRHEITTYFPIGNLPHFFSFDGAGTVITYQQDWFILAAGFSIGTNIFSPFSFEFSFKISPLTYCAAIDNHLFDSITTYYDFTYGGLFIEPIMGVFYSVNKLDISFEFIYRYISRTKGPSYMEENKSGVVKPISNAGGASLSLFDYRFLFKLRI